MSSKNNTSNKISGVVQQCDQDHEVSSGLRKTSAAKKQKISKRGPGVAELEKMLRERDEKNVLKLNIIGGIVPSLTLVPNNSLPNTHLRSSPFISPSNNSLQKYTTGHPSSSSRRDHHLSHPIPAFRFNSRRDHLPPVPLFHVTTTPSSSNSRRDHLPPVPPFHVNGGNAGSSQSSGRGGVGHVRGRSREVHISGSGAYVPEKTLMPVMWEWEEVSGGGDTKKGEEAPNKEEVSTGSDDHAKMFPPPPPPPPMVQKNPLPYPSSTVNLCSWSSAMLSSSSLETTSSPSSSSRVYHHVDRPSDHSFTLPHEQDNMADIHGKRSRPSLNFPVHNWPPAPPPNVPCQPPSIHPHMSQQLNPSTWSTNNIAVFNLGTAPSPLDRKGKTRVNECHGNPSGHGSAMFIKQVQFPSQEMKESNEGLFPRSSSSSGSEPEASSVHKKSSFFLQQEQNGETEATLGSENLEKCTEKTREIIDLNLKL